MRWYLNATGERLLAGKGACWNTVLGDLNSCLTLHIIFKRIFEILKIFFFIFSPFSFTFLSSQKANFLNSYPLVSTYILLLYTHSQSPLTHTNFTHSLTNVHFRREIFARTVQKLFNLFLLQWHIPLLSSPSFLNKNEVKKGGKENSFCANQLCQPHNILLSTTLISFSF